MQCELHAQVYAAQLVTMMTFFIVLERTTDSDCWQIYLLTSDLSPLSLGNGSLTSCHLLRISFLLLWKHIHFTCGYVLSDTDKLCYSYAVGIQSKMIYFTHLCSCTYRAAGNSSSLVAGNPMKSYFWKSCLRNVKFSALNLNSSHSRFVSLWARGWSFNKERI